MAAENRTTLWIPKDLLEDIEEEKEYSAEPNHSVIRRLLKGGR